MSMSRNQVEEAPRDIERIRRIILEDYDRLRETLDVGMDISITTALIDTDIEKLVIKTLKLAKRPLSWRELKQIFQGVVGEDRLRRVLNMLKARNEIAELTHTRYSLPEYVPPREIQKVKNPGIINKILKTQRPEEYTLGETQ
ncbi:MAG: hypothetical protein GSR84_08740 [Desulfurococcales archaeon]|nr:hypothetical protein [Desulfurococcales archaeon]